MGMAIVAPSPPSSTRTVTTIFGSEIGANEVNQAWVAWSLLHWAVPVLPPAANDNELRSLQLPIVTHSRMPWRTILRFSDAIKLLRRTLSSIGVLVLEIGSIILYPKCGSMIFPPLAMAAVHTATWSGVTRRSPWPMDRL